ncbi:MAG: AAA family ATPase [Minisyncoccia bacterium]
MKKIKLFIGIAGKISSGKSTIAHFIADTYAMPYTSSGEYLKQYCLLNGLSVERKTLQDLGQKFVDEDPKVFFQNIVFSQGEQDYIVFDSIRHTAGIDFIKEISDKSILVYIDVDDKIRYERYCKRQKEGDIVKEFKEFLETDNHPTEKEIDEVKKYADLIIYAGDDYKKIISEYFANNKLI